MAGKRTLGSVAPARWLMAAQLLGLAVLVLALNFLLQTTGGTLFLFASAAPALLGAAVIIVVGVVIHQYRASHRLFEIQSFAPGAVIFRQGTSGDCAYFIHEGAVEVVREDNGKETVLARLGKDQYFGEMALLSNAPRNATVRAASQTRVAALGKNNFLTLLSVLPATKEDILKTVQSRAMQAQSKN